MKRILEYPIGLQPDGSTYYCEVREDGSVSWAFELPGFDCNDDDIILGYDDEDEDDTIPGTMEIPSDAVSTSGVRSVSGVRVRPEEPGLVERGFRHFLSACKGVRRSA